MFQQYVSWGWTECLLTVHKSVCRNQKIEDTDYLCLRFGIYTGQPYLFSLKLFFWSWNKNISWNTYFHKYCVCLFSFLIEKFDFTKHDLNIHLLYVHVVYTGVSPNQEANQPIRAINIALHAWKSHTSRYIYMLYIH